MNALTIYFARTSFIAAIQVNASIGIGELIHDNKTYRLVAANQFFEWLFDTQGNVTGVEFCTLLQDNLWNESKYYPFEKYIDLSNGMPRVWFSSSRNGCSRGLQDWEDYYYRDVDGDLLVLLSTHMLDEIGMSSLSTVLRS